MHPSPSSDASRTNGQSRGDINGKEIASHIIEFVMEKYPLQDSWAQKHEKVPVTWTAD